MHGPYNITLITIQYTGACQFSSAFFGRILDNLSSVHTVVWTFPDMSEACPVLSC